MKVATSGPKHGGGHSKDAHTECTLKLLGHTRFPHLSYRITSPKSPCVGCCWAWHSAPALGFLLWRSAVCVSSSLGNSCFLGTFPISKMPHKGKVIHVVTTNNWINGGRGWNHLPNYLSCWWLSFLGICGFQTHLYSSQPSTVHECRTPHWSVFHGIQIMIGWLGMEYQHPELTSMVSKEGKLLRKALESSGNVLAK